MAPAEVVSELNAAAAAGREQQKIAQALHDTVCQSLSGASLEAAVLSRKLEAIGSEYAGEAKRLRELIRQAVNELHGLVNSLQREAADSATNYLPSPAEIHRASPNPRQ